MKFPRINYMNIIKQINQIVIIMMLFNLANAYADSKPLYVVSSFSILDDLVKNVGGDRIKTDVLVSANGDAHIYEAKPSDIKMISTADIIFVNGLGFEPFIDRIKDSNQLMHQIVIVSDGIIPLNAENDEMGISHHHNKHEDPHAWNDVNNVIIYIDNIVTALCKKDTENCNYYKDNGEQYQKQLKQLNIDIKQLIHAIPEDRKTVITGHDAFNYFSHAYGIQFLSPESLSTESDVSAGQMAKLIQQIKRQHASAIFVENNINPRLINQLMSETGIHLGGTLYPDSLSDSSGEADTYLKLMKHNSNTLYQAIMKN